MLSTSVHCLCNMCLKHVTSEYVSTIKIYLASFIYNQLMSFPFKTKITFHVIIREDNW